MASNLKPLSELDAAYDGKQVDEVVAFVKRAGIRLSGDDNYIFRRDADGSIHIYSAKGGIRDYDTIGGKPGYVTAISSSREGVEIGIKDPKVKRVVLHSQPGISPTLFNLSAFLPRRDSDAGESKVSRPKRHKSRSSTGTSDGESRGIGGYGGRVRSAE